MKTLLSVAVASTLVAVVFLSDSVTLKTESRFESEVACTWFPICKDPYFHDQSPAELQEQFDFRMDDEYLISCTWFPICKDPTLPLYRTDGQSEAAVA